MPTYIVQPGDTLPSIARNFLGSTARWRELQLYNLSLLVDPTALRPGMTLRLPPDAAIPARTSAAAARKRKAGSAPSKDVGEGTRLRAFSRSSRRLR